MSSVQWAIHGRRIRQLQLLLWLPRQFNALPTYGNCSAVVGVQIDTGFHGGTSLDGLRLAGIFRYPKAIHEGDGEALPHRRAGARTRRNAMRCCGS